MTGAGQNRFTLVGIQMFDLTPAAMLCLDSLSSHLWHCNLGDESPHQVCLGPHHSPILRIAHALLQWPQTPSSTLVRRSGLRIVHFSKKRYPGSFRTQSGILGHRSSRISNLPQKQLQCDCTAKLIIQFRIFHNLLTALPSWQRSEQSQTDL